ncbi:transcriptional activator of glycolytic enzymes-domain-containing protein [Parasitella parasitica]|nr:transcriptional activator of glycolytic enzymes-domain-containing protein [Parasitella parasitica]
MSRGIVSLTDLWREWSEGFCGGPAVLDLERQYGTRWRDDEGVKKFFLRRNAIIKVIQQYAEERHIVMKTAVGIAEKRRVQKGKTIHWLSMNKAEIFGSS